MHFEVFNIARFGVAGSDVPDLLCRNFHYLFASLFNETSFRTTCSDAVSKISPSVSLRHVTFQNLICFSFFLL